MINKTLLLLALCCPALFFLPATPLSAQDSLRTRANMGDALAQATLSEALRFGIALPVNEREAFLYAEKSAAQRHPIGIFCVAECLNNGIGTARNRKQALELYKQALPGLYELAAKESAMAQFALGRMYAFASALPVNDDSSRIWYTAAAKNGHPVAQLMRGGSLFSSAQTPDDFSTAMSMLHNSAEKGFAEAQCALGDLLTDNDSTKKEGFLWMRKAAQLEYPKAEYILGAYYYAGIGVERDTVESMKWFIAAADHGYKQALAEIGYRTATGTGLVRNPQDALKWMTACIALCSPSVTDLLSFVGAQRDSLNLSEREKRAAISAALSYVKEQQKRQALAAYQLREYLCADSRKIWKRVYQTSTPQLYMAFARSGDMRQSSVQNDGDYTISEGTWSLSEDGSLLTLSAEKEKTTYAVVLLAPGMLCLQQSSGEGWEYLQWYEAVAANQLSRAPGFNSPSNPFALPKIRIKKAEVENDGRVKVTVQIKNLPADGATITIGGYSLKENATDADKVIEPEYVSGDIGEQFDDGEKTLYWNPSRQLAANKQYDLRLFVDFSWSAEGRFRASTERTAVLHIDTHKRK